MLCCSRLVEVRLVNAFGRYREIRRVLEEESSGEVFLFCAGMTSKVWISDLLRKRKTITCLDLGRALDPLFVSQTRSHQLSQKEVRQFFKPHVAHVNVPCGQIGGAVELSILSCALGNCRSPGTVERKRRCKGGYRRSGAWR